MEISDLLSEALQTRVKNEILSCYLLERIRDRQDQSLEIFFEDSIKYEKLEIFLGIPCPT